MENTMQIFKNSDFGEIRTISIAGELWFVAKDVCDVLGIQNVSDTVKKVLDEDESSTDTIYTRSDTGVNQRRKVIIINESGLYHLIFISRKPEARSFRRWITHEVLPQIRKTGSYGNSDDRMNSVVNKMLDIQKQQMDIIRSLVGTDSPKDRDVYNEPQGVLNSTQFSDGDMFTEYSGQIIRDIRNRIGISQRELANRAHIERCHVVHIENEKHKPSTPVFFRLLNAMGYMIILLNRGQLKGGENE